MGCALLDSLITQSLLVLCIFLVKVLAAWMSRLSFPRSSVGSRWVDTVHACGHGQRFAPVRMCVQLNTPIMHPNLRRGLLCRSYESHGLGVRGWWNSPTERSLAAAGYNSSRMGTVGDGPVSKVKKRLVGADLKFCQIHKFKPNKKTHKIECTSCVRSCSHDLSQAEFSFSWNMTAASV